MRVFSRMAAVAASRLLGGSAESRWSNEQLAKQLEEMALDDPELAAHYRGLAAAVPALQAVRLLEDAA
ncbi:MAG: hypothetical protein ACLP9L_19615 [Thermoguttaceae bacterium]